MAGRTTYLGKTDPRDARIRELESDLFFARVALFNRLDERLQDIINTMPIDATFSEVYRWFEGAMSDVIDLAEPLSAEERTDTTHNGDRARCPLCGDSANDYYNPNNGFAYPQGLRRHLLGTHNNTQCEVSKQILSQARYVITLPG